MRIVILTNVYPPHMIGGYEVICAHVVRELEARGHECFVLTSNFKGTTSDGNDSAEARVRRSLVLTNRHCSDESPNKLERNVVWQLGVERYDLGLFRRYLGEVRPDLLFAWNTYALPLSLLFEAQAMGLKTVHYVADWSFGLHPGWWRAHEGKGREGVLQSARGALTGFLMQQFLPYNYSAVRLAPRRAIFCSQSMLDGFRQRGLPLDKAEVIYPGIEMPPEDEEPLGRETSSLPRLVYLGRVTEEKGVHTALEAMNSLVNERGYSGLKLTVLGHIFQEDYRQKLNAIVANGNLYENVVFLGGVPSKETGRLLSCFDALVFPSIWDEPFGLTRIEAMARGLAVVSTTTGAGKEILVDGENALTFAPGDPVDLANQIERLIRHPDLRTRLGEAGRAQVLQIYSVPRMVDKIENYLSRVAGAVDARDGVSCA